MNFKMLHQMKGVRHKEYILTPFILSSSKNKSNLE